MANRKYNKIIIMATQRIAKERNRIPPRSQYKCIKRNMAFNSLGHPPIIIVIVEIICQTLDKYGEVCSFRYTEGVWQGLTQIEGLWNFWTFLSFYVILSKGVMKVVLKDNSSKHFCINADVPQRSTLSSLIHPDAISSRLSIYAHDKYLILSQ